MQRLCFWGASLWVISILNGCAHSAIPNIYVPKQKGELSVTTALGFDLSGVHANASYAVTDEICVQGAAQYSFPYSNRTFYRELGIGIKPGIKEWLFSMEYGRAEYGYGTFSYGGTYGIYWHDGQFNKLSITANFSSDKNYGAILRFASVKGKESGGECQVCSPYKDLPFARVFFEPAFFAKYGKKRRFFLMANLRVPLVKQSRVRTSGDEFMMPYGSLAMGWNFRILKGKKKPE